ncbi:DUF484 family protein [Thalassotalea agarivorans]|uniref:Diguanylate cyclase (GGDEF) domain-containing protein n=1 Tax=Thalassotalea agarivorans TaxID=349064 RepID=A0A1I0I1T7_THASX|nr:DUF484 family protein [Thalassotalea agarivorans]SET90193.1 diguanylate cyclase (GGDEF) domain-containing protein [Thalassotalea agarivorans]
MSELEQLIANSRVNESISRKLFAIETEILACRSSNELLKTLLDSIQDKFKLQGICLLLVEPSPISYINHAENTSDWHQQHILKVSSYELNAFHHDDKPFLTNQLAELGNTLPLNILAQASSVALTPLKMENKLFASLVFISNDPQRFHSGLGTFHLEQLAVKIGLCLSNVLIREQLEYMALYDNLTGVGNRRLMENDLKEELMRHQRYKIPFSVLFIDLNKFKPINDTYGHDCGDAVLHYVANTLKELVRENDKVYRYAGDEFVVLLSGQNYQEAELAAKRLSDYFFARKMPYQDKQLTVTISAGAAASDAKKSVDQLLKEADEQLYHYKKLAHQRLAQG